jgi:hypothetical protein
MPNKAAKNRKRERIKENARLNREGRTSKQIEKRRKKNG